MLVVKLNGASQRCSTGVTKAGKKIIYDTQNQGHCSPRR
jgi:hypothetical protein